MAHKVQMIVSVVDDLDGTEGATVTRKFGVGKQKDRVVDLIEGNAELFDGNVERWTSQLVRRTLTVDRKTHHLWLRPDDAARFDEDWAPWLDAAKLHDRAERQAGGGKAAPAPRKAATAATAAKSGRSGGAADYAPAPEDLVPVVGEEWWRGNSPLHKRAKGIVRRWARTHGWPTLGERGRIPAEAFDKWVATVWSNLDEQTWDAAEIASRSNRRSRKPATTTAE